ncbi:hypothetical protein MKW98_003417 [Papaver atlanticum]|uniref:Uncharacterized protein n=1 Tax=Papaver atlanticum TaxID=357466 RepID=A0AAD4T8N6_9MAGN|nr:hypothetical protein MKW98_003417 [Papaver atlanticum]
MCEEPSDDSDDMSGDDYKEYMSRKDDEWTRISTERIDKNLKALIAKEAPLVEKQKREAKKREVIQAREMQAYLKNNPLNKKSFISDIERYSSICVFSFGYAKLESPKYKKFIKSLNDDNSYKVYFGRKKSLSRIVGLASEAEFNPEFKPGDRGYETKELRPGLHKIGSMLQNYDDAAVLLTDKTKDEMVFEKNEFLSLPSRSSATNLCVKLKELGMAVELSGGRIKLTKIFNVCEDGVRVTEDATKILRLLKNKMFKYVLVPLCYWSASTGETEYFRLDTPKSQ